MPYKTQDGSQQKELIGTKFQKSSSELELWFSHLSKHQNPLEGLVKSRVLDPTLHFLIREDWVDLRFGFLTRS